jgi:hypothetical protein
MRALFHIAVTIWLLAGCSVGPAAAPRAGHAHATEPSAHARSLVPLETAGGSEVAAGDQCGRSELVIASNDESRPDQARALPQDAVATPRLPRFLKASPPGRASDRASPLTPAGLLGIPLRL